MSWMQRLYETYEKCAVSDLPDVGKLLPVAHTTQQAHIEITIDAHGNFRRARVVPREESTTLIPCTESSSGRSGSKPVNHPLCDKLQYIAADFVMFGGAVTAGFSKDPEEPHRLFVRDLAEWAESASHPKLKAILKYVQSGAIVSKLVKEGVLPARSGRLVTEWGSDETEAQPEVFKVVADPSDSFVRWAVESEGAVCSATWLDKDLIQSWIARYADLKRQRKEYGFCCVLGEELPLGTQHPAKIRNAGDKAKLISSNDSSGFTFLGRFTSASEALEVSFEVTQKAHNALKWLIDRQGTSLGGKSPLTVVSWAAGGRIPPDPWVNSMALFEGVIAEEDNATLAISVGDVGQYFSLRLNKAIAGYRARLDDSDAVMVMGLDSATPGRMAVTFYRELTGSEFLDRIQRWHHVLAWPQNFGKTQHFVGAPSPRDIAEAAYGQRIDDKLKKSTVERLLPCIVDGRDIPKDLVELTVRRTVNRVGMKGKKGQERSEWEKCLGIACSLFKGHNHQKGYAMALEENRKTREYLYGRLLAVAEHIEARALYVAGENRDTMASRLMQRFADHPHSTW